MALADERHARRAAVEQATKLEARLAQVTTERDRARALAAEASAAAGEAAAAAESAGQEVEELRALLQAAEEEMARLERAASVVVLPPEPAEHEQHSQALDVAGAAAALIDAARAAAALADGLASVATSLQPSQPPQPHATGAGRAGPGSPTVGAIPAAGGTGAGPAPSAGDKPRPRGGPRPVPVALPPGIFDDSVEAADHLVRVPGVAVLVDGYNVSKLGWPDQPISEQRRRLVDALSEMSARTGAEVAVVFDGADTVWSPQVPSTGRRVRVLFSPPGVEADDVVIARAAELRPFRPVVVASSDNRVRAGSAGAGANVISSPQLLAVLHR